MKYHLLILLPVVLFITAFALYYISEFARRMRSSVLGFSIFVTSFLTVMAFWLFTSTFIIIKVIQ